MHVVLVEPHFSGHRPGYLYVYSKLLIELGHKVSIVSSEVEKYRKYLSDEKKMESVLVYPFKRTVYTRSLFSSYSFYPYFDLWITIRDSVRAIEGVDFVFLMYFDFFIFDFNDSRFLRSRVNKLLNRFILPVFIDRCLPKPWTTIYFHPVLFSRKEYGNIFRARHNRSVCLLDETWKLNLPVKKEFVLPDITDEEYPEVLSAMAGEVLKKANGRKIVSLLGSLDKRKGIIPLIDAIDLMDREKYFFLIAGKLDINYSETEMNRIACLKGNSENCYLHLDSIPTDNDFNSLVKISDILYLCYMNFFHSSNLLTKASLFKKPVVATAQHCIGARVRKYHLGITIADISGLVIKDSLEKFDILYDPDKSKQDEYLHLHSQARLKEVLIDILKS